jgi:hypothetical protein
MLVLDRVAKADGNNVGDLVLVGDRATRNVEVDDVVGVGNVRICG